MVSLSAEDEMQRITTPRKASRVRSSIRSAALLFVALLALFVSAQAQTDCVESNSALEMTPPKDMTPDALIQKFTAAENRVRDARSHYTYTQDVLVQTLNDTSVTGQFHQVTNISYDDKGKRIENVTFSEQPTLRDISMSAEDMDDIREFMPWILTTDQASEYKLTYAGQQHVDDLDTYVFHVEPKTIEKNKRYFQGRIWVDNRDLVVVKLCGKTVPAQVKKKKNQTQEVRPTFVGYRQLIDGYWFPVYARVDDTLQFHAESVHVREIVKFKDYKRAGTASAASKP
jgi:outer membrane lipoprotein-sorting protein